MKMSFDGIFGIWFASRCRRDAAAGDESGCRCAEAASLNGASRCEASGLSVGKGGGYGEIEMDVTEAECAWYTRMD